VGYIRAGFGSWVWTVPGDPQAGPDLDPFKRKCVRASIATRVSVYADLQAARAGRHWKDAGFSTGAIVVEAGVAGFVTPGLKLWCSTDATI
jgi:hypothetical protein